MDACFPHSHLYFEFSPDVPTLCYPIVADVSSVRVKRSQFLLLAAVHRPLAGGVISPGPD